MDFPLGFIKEILGYESVEDLIENLYLKSLINASSIVKNIPNIHNFNENGIRDEFQKIITKNSDKLTNFLNNDLINLTVENQIITTELERKRTDIGFFISGLYYIVECKKITSISKSNYIDNGILRFINNIYIKENDIYAGMCSFILSNDMVSLINNAKKRVSESRIKETIDDRIICNHSNSFYSNHHKINNQELILHHLFFDLN